MGYNSCFFIADFSPENAILTFILTANDIAVVNTTLNITCSTEANPPAEFRFYRDGMSLFNTTTGNNVAVFASSVRERKSSVIYSCIPVIVYGQGPTATITITLHCNFLFNRNVHKFMPKTPLIKRDI